jgi:succinyl-diaminopimelate desuccinylase
MIELLKQLINVDSTIEKGELTAARVLEQYFQTHGITAKLDIWDNNRANIIARFPSTGEKPPVLFVCHLDVVGPGDAPWANPPFDAQQIRQRIYGRGAVDMKGGIAACAAAACCVTQSAKLLKGDIIFAATAGEETDSSGVVRLVNSFADIGDLTGVIIPEPTGFEVVTAHRGMLWLNLTTKGKTAHSSTPELGINAISSMRKLLERIDNYSPDFVKHPLLGDCTHSINTISAGKAFNVIPDRCTAGVDFRTIPGQDYNAIVADIEKIISDLKSEHEQFDAEVTVIRKVGSFQTDTECSFVKDICCAVGAENTIAVPFTTDAPYLVSLNAPIVIFGPGDGSLCHKPDEYIQITDLEKGFNHFTNIINTFLT